MPILLLSKAISTCSLKRKLATSKASVVSWKQLKAKVLLFYGIALAIELLSRMSAMFLQARIISSCSWSSDERTLLIFNLLNLKHLCYRWQTAFSFWVTLSTIFFKFLSLNFKPILLQHGTFKSEHLPKHQRITQSCLLLMNCRLLSDRALLQLKLIDLTDLHCCLVLQRTSGIYDMLMPQ